MIFKKVTPFLGIDWLKMWKYEIFGKVRNGTEVNQNIAKQNKKCENIGSWCKVRNWIEVNQNIAKKNVN